MYLHFTIFFLVFANGFQDAILPLETPNFDPPPPEQEIQICQGQEFSSKIAGSISQLPDLKIFVCLFVCEGAPLQKRVWAGSSL